MPVRLRQINKHYGRDAVLHDIAFDIDDHEFVALVGPSGCGKSTLLRMIAGLESISGGTIEIDGKTINDVPPKERDIAMVFQNYALYPHMSVAENMGFSMTLAGAPKAEKARRVLEAAHTLGLESLLDRRPRHLSGGQRQRVAMGRAIVRNPRLFLFDEPLSNLDARLRVQMRTEIKALHQRLRSTTVYVTHDQVEAMTMADRIVVMREGRVEQVGAPLDLFDQPANPFVAEFIGLPAMNLIEGDFDSTDSSCVSDTGLRLPAGASSKALRGQRVIFGIRPEHLEIAAQGIEACIVVVEPTGSETLVFVESAQQPLSALFRERHVLQPGHMLTLQPRLEHVHLFDAATGERLN